MYFYFLEFLHLLTKCEQTIELNMSLFWQVLQSFSSGSGFVCEDETGNGKLGGVPGEPCQPVAHPRLAVRHCAPRSYFTCYAQWHSPAAYWHSLAQTTGHHSNQPLPQPPQLAGQLEPRLLHPCQDQCYEPNAEYSTNFIGLTSNWVPDKPNPVCTTPKFQHTTSSTTRANLNIHAAQ